MQSYIHGFGTFAGFSQRFQDPKHSISLLFHYNCSSVCMDYNAWYIIKGSCEFRCAAIFWSLRAPGKTLRGSRQCVQTAVTLQTKSAPETGQECYVSVYSFTSIYHGSVHSAGLIMTCRLRLSQINTTICKYLHWSPLAMIIIEITFINMPSHALKPGCLGIREKDFPYFYR